MSSCCNHLGFLTDTKHIHLADNHPMSIVGKSQFKWLFWIVLYELYMITDMYMFHLCGHHQRIKFNLEPNRKCVVKLSENTEPFESKD
jgi:hypothetical protein